MPGIMWRNNCPGHARLVIDDYTESVELSREDAVSKYPETVEFTDVLRYFYEVTFAKIKVVDSSINNIYSKVELPRESIEQIISVVTSAHYYYRETTLEERELLKVQRKKERDEIFQNKFIIYFELII